MAQNNEQYKIIPGLPQRMMKELGDLRALVRQNRITANLLVQHYPADPPQFLMSGLNIIEAHVSDLRTQLNQWNQAQKFQAQVQTLLKEEHECQQRILAIRETLANIQDGSQQQAEDLDGSKTGEDSDAESLCEYNPLTDDSCSRYTE